MLYVDSNVFIYPVVYDEKFVKSARICKKILIKIARGEIEAATASLTWDELVWVVRKTLGVEESNIEGKNFLKLPNLKILDVSESTLRYAQKILTENKLKPRDAIHAACALENKINKIITDDPDFDKIKGIKRIKLERV
jgi:predicted nucleic acid-binding protein